MAARNKSAHLTLAACTAACFLLVLALYMALSGRSPANRIGYAIFVSAAPAIGSLVVIKIMRRLFSWLDALLLYLGLFTLVVILQAVARLIPM